MGGYLGLIISIALLTHAGAIGVSRGATGNQRVFLFGGMGILLSSVPLEDGYWSLVFFCMSITLTVRGGRELVVRPA
jgi:hypothetical protein